MKWSAHEHVDSLVFTQQLSVPSSTRAHRPRKWIFRRIEMKMLYPGFDSRRTRKAFDGISRMMSNERSSMDETFDNGRIRHAEIVRDGLPPGTWLGALRVAVVVEGHLEQAPEALLTKAVNSGSVGVGMSDVIRCQMSEVRSQMSDVRLDRVRARYSARRRHRWRIPYSSSVECTS